MLGCTLFVMLTGHFPFHRTTADTKKLHTTLDTPSGPYPPTHHGYWQGRHTTYGNKRPAQLAHDYLSENQKQLLNLMWDTNFARRITTEGILGHTWLNFQDDGTPWEDFDMAAAVAEARGGAEPRGLLAEIVRKKPDMLNIVRTVS